MATKYHSIYKSTLDITGNVTITLNEDERKMICEALTNCAPKETDILPLMILMDRIVRGKE